MGFDFYVENTNEHLYLSYNWSDLSNIEIDGKKIHLWYIRDDLFNKKGSYVSARIERALKILREKLNIQPSDPDPSMSSWGWGVDNDGKLLPYRERLSIFSHHLMYYKKIADKYPHNFFRDEDYDPDYDPDYDKYDNYNNYNNDSNGNSNLNDDSNLDNNIMDTSVMYYEHPTKGTLKISNFDEATEIYGFELSQGTSREKAKKWLDIALKMHDAPSYFNK
jgi:hypothetical protein